MPKGRDPMRSMLLSKKAQVFQNNFNKPMKVVDLSKGMMNVKTHRMQKGKKR